MFHCIGIDNKAKEKKKMRKRKNSKNRRKKARKSENQKYICRKSSNQKRKINTNGVTCEKEMGRKKKQQLTKPLNK